MREMTKSAVRVAREALAVGRAALPPYSGPHARHDYTQPPLLALLAVRQHLRVDYRGLAVLLGEWAELRAALGLRKVPHYSTLCDAAHRLPESDPHAAVCLVAVEVVPLGRMAHRQHEVGEVRRFVPGGRQRDMEADLALVAERLNP